MFKIPQVLAPPKEEESYLPQREAQPTHQTGENFPSELLSPPPPNANLPLPGTHRLPRFLLLEAADFCSLKAAE